MGWFSNNDAHAASEQARCRQEELAREATAKRQADQASAAEADRITRDHDRSSWWFSR